MFDDIYRGLRESYDRIDSLSILEKIYKHMEECVLKYELYDFIYDKSLYENLCPKCLDYLIVEDIVTNTHEFMGGMTMETHLVLKCENCNTEYE